MLMLRIKSKRLKLSSLGLTNEIKWDLKQHFLLPISQNFVLQNMLSNENTVCVRIVSPRNKTQKNFKNFFCPQVA
jgi:hypothetical protein